MTFKARKCPHCGYSPTLTLTENPDTSLYLYLHVKCCTEQSGYIGMSGKTNKENLNKKIQNEIDNVWNTRPQEDTLISALKKLSEHCDIEQILDEDDYYRVSNLIESDNLDEISASEYPKWMTNYFN